MKLRKLLSKEVDYFGIKLTVPSDLMYIATDADGLVYGYFDEPTINLALWWRSWSDNSITLATVELGDTDWRETLRFV